MVSFPLLVLDLCNRLTIRSAPLSGQQECPEHDLCNFQMREGEGFLLVGKCLLQKSDCRANSCDKLLHCTKAHIRVLVVELSCIQSSGLCYGVAYSNHWIHLHIAVTEVCSGLCYAVAYFNHWIHKAALLLLWQFGATSANGITNKFDPKVIIEVGATL
jgi:hypothetical protein